MKTCVELCPDRREIWCHPCQGRQAGPCRHTYCAACKRPHRKVLTNPQIDATDCVRCHGAGMRGPDEFCPACEGTGGEPRYEPKPAPPEVPAPDERLRDACDELLRTIQELELSGSDSQLDAFEAAESKLRDVMSERYVRAREGGR